MLVYLSVIILIIIFSSLAKVKTTEHINDFEISKKKHNNFFIFLIFLVLGLVAGLRWKVGTDYQTYSRLYGSYKEADWSINSFLDEPGIQAISKISSVIYDDYALMFFFASLITVFFMVKTISSNTSMLMVSLLLFIFTGAWHGSFNGVRQYVAAAIIFAGHKYIVEKKFLEYSLIVGLASLFHISAIACITFYFIPIKKIKATHLALMVVLVFIFTNSYSVLISFAENLRDQTIATTDYATNEVSLLRVLTKIAPVFFYLLFTKKGNLIKKESFYINIMFVNAALVIATSNSAYLSRLWIYTDIFSVLFIPVLIMNLKDKRYKQIFSWVIIMFYSIFWFYEVITIPNLYNFNWIFER